MQVNASHKATFTMMAFLSEKSLSVTEDMEMMASGVKGRRVSSGIGLLYTLASATLTLGWDSISSGLVAMFLWYCRELINLLI